MRKVTILLQKSQNWLKTSTTSFIIRDFSSLQKKVPRNNTLSKRPRKVLRSDIETFWLDIVRCLLVKKVYRVSGLPKYLMFICAEKFCRHLQISLRSILHIRTKSENTSLFKQVFREPNRLFRNRCHENASYK